MRPEEVQAWCDAQGFYYVVTTDVAGNGAGTKTVAELARLERKAISFMIKATVPDANVSLLWNGDIEVYFFFNKDNCLIGQLLVPCERAL
jgi:hypothetical protein